MSLIRNGFFALPVILAAWPALAHAETATDGADGSGGDNIVVTALRTPVQRDRVSSSITVLDQAAIEQEQPVALADVLVRTPGVSMSRNGGYGGVTTLRIRGASSGQTVLVIDGMRMNDPSLTDNGYNFANLLADDIARIEILRGPQSILWGSDAIGGVVSVETAKPVKPLEASFAAEAGSRETVGARAAVGGASEAVDWRVSGSTFNTGGISARSIGTEADGYRRQAANGTATVRLAPDVSVDLRGYWANARNESDGFGGDTPEYGRNREWTGYAGLNAALMDGRFRNRIAILHSDTDRDLYDPRRAVRDLNFKADGRVRRYEYQGAFTPSSGIDLIFGAEREEQRMGTGSPGDNTAPIALTRSSANTDSLYGEARATVIDGLTLNAGARWSSHSRFGDNTVFSGGAVWSLNQSGTVLRASYDEGFKAPSLYQLFSNFGSATLKPEKARGWEAGIEQSLLNEAVRLSATWFQRDTDNLIDFASCPFSGPLPAECFIPGTTTPRFGYYANVSKSRARGLELAGSARFGGLFAEANYTWVSAEDKTPGFNFGEQLARMPRNLANGEIGYAFPFGVTASVAMRYSGKSRDFVGGGLLDDYLLTDVRVEWKVAPEVTAYGRVENIADERYETAGGYGSLGRSVYLGVRSRF